jgi:hypothetical protein
MRPSFEALPSWLGRLPEVPPTPVRAYRPPEESVLQRALANPRLPLHVGLFAVVLGIGAAVAAGSVRVKHTAMSQAEMSAFAERKAAELRAFGTLRSARTRGPVSPLAPGGSLTADVPGYSDVVEGTDGRRFQRRWDIDAAPTGSRRIMVRIIPASPRAGRDSFEVTTFIPRPRPSAADPASRGSGT